MSGRRHTGDLDRRGAESPVSGASLGMCAAVSNVIGRTRELLSYEPQEDSASEVTERKPLPGAEAARGIGTISDVVVVHL